MARRAVARHGSARPQTEAEPVYKQNCSAMPKLADICADEGEMLAISVSRFIAAAYMTSDAVCWDAAYDCAEAILGPDEGCLFVARIGGVIRALRAERSAPWHFLPATCCRLTADEQGLVALLSAARHSGSEAVDCLAAVLADGEDAPRLAAAAGLAAAAICRAGGLLGHCPRQPHRGGTAVH